ncbi:MAG: S41 family peptidase [Cytophagaceae bacterium]|nr:S41 family peptidase [Gemmatimonadaceae bacterium]
MYHLQELSLRIREMVLLAVASGATGCSGSVDAPQGGPQAAAASYLEYVVATMRANSVHRLRIDWTEFTKTVNAAANQATSISDTYPAIRVAIGLLGDGHTFYRTITGVTLAVPTRSCAAPAPIRPTVPANIGYVRIEGYSGNMPAEFAQRIQDSIRTHDRVGLAGWIVDLRGNTGGNMWPMVAGVGPVLGEATLGYFIGPTGGETMWEYRDGASRLNGTPVQSLLATYRVIRENPRVAVLTDNGTASSGEAVAISFRKRPDTRTFGGGTCGLSTANQGYAMPDGAVLQLTTALMADRTKASYGDVVPPDEVITDQGQLAQRAVAWILTGQ